MRNLKSARAKNELDEVRFPIYILSFLLVRQDLLVFIGDE